MGGGTGNGKVSVDYDTVESLASVLGQRAKDLSDVSGWISGLSTLQNGDVSAGQSFVQKVWSTAVSLLGQDVALTSGKVDKSVNVYEKGDTTVGIQLQASVPHATGGRAVMD